MCPVAVRVVREGGVRSVATSHRSLDNAFLTDVIDEHGLPVFYVDVLHDYLAALGDWNRLYGLSASDLDDMGVFVPRHRKVLMALVPSGKELSSSSATPSAAASFRGSFCVDFSDFMTPVGSTRSASNGSGRDFSVRRSSSRGSSARDVRHRYKEPIASASPTSPSVVGRAVSFLLVYPPGPRHPSRVRRCIPTPLNFPFRRARGLIFSKHTSNCSLPKRCRITSQRVTLVTPPPRFHLILPCLKTTLPSLRRVPRLFASQVSSDCASCPKRVAVIRASPWILFVTGRGCTMTRALPAVMVLLLMRCVPHGRQCWWRAVVCVWTLPTPPRLEAGPAQAHPMPPHRTAQITMFRPPIAFAKSFCACFRII